MAKISRKCLTCKTEFFVDFKSNPGKPETMIGAEKNLERLIAKCRHRNKYGNKETTRGG